MKEQYFPDDLLHAFELTRQFLVGRRHELSPVVATKELGGGAQSSVMEADLQAEQRLVAAFHLWEPTLPLLCEEAERSGLAHIVPHARLLPYDDGVKGLPKVLASFDGLDFSVGFANGELSLSAMSVGIIRKGQPSAGLVVMLNDPSPYHVGLDGSCDVYHRTEKWPMWRESHRPLNQSLMGVDMNKAVDPFVAGFCLSLMTSRETRYPLNLPSVAGAINVLRGNLAFYLTSNARHWDIAGGAALCWHAGLVVGCLDGQAVPWNRVRMPPVVFARDEETFMYVHEAFKKYRREHE